MSLPVLRALLVTAALSCSTAALAAGPNWSTALPADAVASQIEGTGVKLVVVSAGAGSSEATAAVLDALRKAPAVALAMPADGLGDVSKLDDASIVAKAKSLPVGHVAIVRVFDGKDGAKSAVVTLYTTAGATVSAFSGATDAPLVARQTSGAGMSGAAGAVVEGVVGGASADREARVKQFEERAIWMQGYAAVDARSGRVVSTWSVPMKGKYGEPFRGAAFYDYVGKPEFAATYRKRQTTRGAIWGGSAAVLGGGAAYWLLAMKEEATTYGGRGTPCWGLLDDDYEPTTEWRTCKKEIAAHNAVVNVVGVTLVSVGTVGVLVPLFIDPHPAKTNERERMVDEYNDALAKELGLTAAAAPPPRPRLAAGAWATAEGGGVTLAGEF